jgi:phospholipase/lecithinase/hemolysin
MLSLTHARTVFVLLLTLGFSSLTHAAFSQVVGFGDSLSDTGNYFATTGTPTPPYDGGRFSNGPVWLEVVAQQLGLASPTASAAGGTNYAWGGARTTALADGFIPSTQTQVATYLGDVGGVADPNALYTILTGGNDINAVASGSATLTDLANDGLAVASIANDLLLAGAQHILVMNVPDLGTAPISEGNEASASLVTSIFNGALFQGLADLGSSATTFIDAFTISQDIVANPGAYGLTNVSDNCLLATGGLGAACDGYLFWDDLHPTADGHRLIGQAALAAVIPVPAAAWLFGSALLCLAGLRRRK